MNQTVQPTQSILISIEAEFCALQNYREFLFSNFILVFELYNLKNMYFCLKNWNSRWRNFFQNSKIEKKNYVTL